MKILILCTGNSCRSQMAEGYIRSFRPGFEVHSAGTFPASRVHPQAIKVMKEDGVDISMGKPKSVDRYIEQTFDYVITVCDHANETCPVFTGNVKQRLHLGFDDPAMATGSNEDIMGVFRRVREEIKSQFKDFLDRIDPKN
jgi:arsenate reductase (thioredoxin)